MVLASLPMAHQCVSWFRRRYSHLWDPSVDRDDLLGEAYLGLCRAAVHWNSARGDFRTFARVVINRRLLGLLRQSRKAVPTPFALISLDTPQSEEEELLLGDILPADELLPEERLVQKDLTHAVDQALDQFPLELQQLVQGRLAGQTLRELAKQHRCSPNDVAIAIRRALRRLAPEVGEWHDQPLQ